MCTSIAMRNGGFYFGRNMDIDFSFDEKIVVTPRNYPLNFRRACGLERHYALTGMAAVCEDYPLYAEAMNECGLGMAGLNFPENAVYPKVFEEGMANISPFELIPWILGQCETVLEAKRLLLKTHIVGVPFSREIPLAKLHWHIADRKASIVLEVTGEGTRIYDNPADVLTNSPTFDFHLHNLAQYANLSVETPKGCLDGACVPFGKGLGSFGLPGDFSSGSRFVKAAYLLKNSACGKTEHENVCQFFHLLDSVSVISGSMPEKGYKTAYSCCMSDRGVYYFKGYHSTQLSAVDMRREALDGDKLVVYEFETDKRICYVNGARR